VIELLLVGVEARYDISQTFSIGQLSEGHTEKLIETRKTPDFVIAVISKNALIELVSRQMLKQLSEDRFSRIHLDTSSVGTEADYKTNQDKLSSNRKVAFWPLCFCITASYRAFENR